MSLLFIYYCFFYENNTSNFIRNIYLKNEEKNLIISNGEFVWYRSLFTNNSLIFAGKKN